jgi:hypothetical protein
MVDCLESVLSKMKLQQGAHMQGHYEFNQDR